MIRCKPIAKRMGTLIIFLIERFMKKKLFSISLSMDPVYKYDEKKSSKT